MPNLLILSKEAHSDAINLTNVATTLHCWGFIFMLAQRRAKCKRYLARIFLSSILIISLVVTSSVLFVNAQTKSTSTVSVIPKSQVPIIEYNNTQGECPFTVLEGNVLRLRAEGFDPDSDIGPAGELLWSYAAPLSPFGYWQTRIGDAGTYRTAITLSDGELSDTLPFCIDVLSQPTLALASPLNQAPKLIGVDDILIDEGQSVSFTLACIDPDGDDVSITVNSQVPYPVYNSKQGDAGNYLVQVTCTDTHGAARTALQQVVVKKKNHPLQISVANITASKGDVVIVQPSITLNAPFPSNQHKEIVEVVYQQASQNQQASSNQTTAAVLDVPASSQATMTGTTIELHARPKVEPAASATFTITHERRAQPQLSPEERIKRFEIDHCQK